MNNTYFTSLPKALLTIAIGMLLSVNAWAQEAKSLVDLKNEVKDALNCSFVTTEGVPDNEAYEVLDFVLQDSKTFTFKHPYLRKIAITNSDRGMYTENSGNFTGITLPNTRDKKFLDYCLRHEIGHVIDHAREARDSKEWTTTRKHVDTKSISTYAGKNDQELFAEMVAYRTSKEYGKSLAPLSGDVEKMIDKDLYN
jgi:hypothetical protein